MQLNIQNPAKCRTWNSFQRGWHWQEGHSSTHLVALVCWPGYKSSHYRIPYRRSYLVEQRIAAESWAFGRFGLGPKRTIGWGSTRVEPDSTWGKILKQKLLLMQLQPAVLSSNNFYHLFAAFFGGAVPKKIPSNPPNKRTRILLLWCFFERPWNVGRSEMAIQWISPNFSKFIILKIILKSLSLTFSMFPNQPSTMKVPTLNPQAHPSPDSKTTPPPTPHRLATLRPINGGEVSSLALHKALRDFDSGRDSLEGWNVRKKKTRRIQRETNTTITWGKTTWWICFVLFCWYYSSWSSILVQGCEKVIFEC